MNKCMVKIMIAAVLSGCAATPEKAQAQRWKEADIDGNDVMTQAEFEASKLRTYMTFEAVDINGDNLISLEEYRHYNGQLRPQRDRSRSRRSRT